MIARSYFSPNTLPESTRVGGDAKPALARPQPALPSRLNLMAASRDDGTTLRDATGTCLARYRVEHDVLSFSLDDDCMLEQVGAILPEVAAYETGLLDFLLRGELHDHRSASQIAVTGKGLGTGYDRGPRRGRARRARASSPAARPPRAARSSLRVAAPSAGTRVVAVYRGADASGEPIVAVGAMPLTR